jgi:hypothetical protein
MLLAFAPFLVFAVAANLWGGIVGLIAGAATSALLLAKELGAKRSPKILEVGTFLMFAGLAAWARLNNSHWSIFTVRLLVDSGLLGIILITIVIRQPFTLQYARDRVPEHLWASPRFLHTNDVITGAWALAFACMVAADFVMAYVPGVPLWIGIAVTVLALLGAYQFTGWYPKRATAAAKA